MQAGDIYEQGLDANNANYVPLSPLTFLRRTSIVYPQRRALIDGGRQFSWSQVFERCLRLADALQQLGIKRNATVAALCPNSAEMFELHFAVAMAGGVLNAINTRLDAATIAFFLNHGQARLFMVDMEFFDLASDALAKASNPPRMVTIAAPGFANADADAQVVTTYDELLQMGRAKAAKPLLPDDEWQAITLSYTSGTTGDPKGVVYHHRGAYLSAVANILTWELGNHPVYLWTLPMFHCNGWCFPWTLAAVAGVSVCLRQVRAAVVGKLIREHGVNHLCAAPIVLNTLLNAPAEERGPIPPGLRIMTAGAAPPEAVIQGMEKLGCRITHVYGLTETYGPATLCAWQEEWNTKPAVERAALNARQGLQDHMLEDLMVADPKTMQPVPADGKSPGEVMMRGNKVMKGYLRNAQSTMDAFAGGWFHTGDVAVVHQDGYIQIRDRSKDIIISGGENISSIEIEDVLYKHPNILEAAVVARKDSKWGESPCAFVTLMAGATETEQSIIDYCRANMAAFKVPKTVVFATLPKTSTGKIQKYVLRAEADRLATHSS